VPQRENVRLPIRERLAILHRPFVDVLKLLCQKAPRGEIRVKIRIGAFGLPTLSMAFYPRWAALCRSFARSANNATLGSIRTRPRAYNQRYIGILGIRI
jgi:hypothetical protein